MVSGAAGKGWWCVVVREGGGGGRKESVNVWHATRCVTWVALLQAAYAIKLGLGCGDSKDMGTPLCAPSPAKEPNKHKEAPIPIPFPPTITTAPPSPPRTDWHAGLWLCADCRQFPDMC